MRFDERVRQLRLRAGITQAELARRAGICLDTIRNWRRRRNVPGLFVVVRLARALGITLDTLVEGVTEESYAPSWQVRT